VLSHICLSICIRAARQDWPELVLDERILRISQIAVDLSSLAYENATVLEQWVVSFNQTSGLATYNHPDYDEINFYIDVSDQAIVAKKEGRCYLAFRGTNKNNIPDWLQNAGLGTVNIYKDNIDTGNAADSCEARGGFADFLRSDSVARGRKDLQNCVDSCEDPNDCLVITGHSQGGAISTLAAVTLNSLKPTVVTFGQPPSMDPDCPFINNTRYYRYVNWIQLPGKSAMGFDVVVYSPNWISGSGHYGFNILVGEDPTSVYYGGYGNDVEFVPNVLDIATLAHSISGTNQSYQSRIYDLYENIPNIGVNGSALGTICKDAYIELCSSNTCLDDVCVPEGSADGTCIKGSCERDSDCDGDLVCIWDACATAVGEVQPGCPCRTSSQCYNKDCITVNALTLDFVCNPDTPIIPKVSETCIKDSCELNSDCAAGMVCIYGACATGSGQVQPGCPCASSSQCSNKDCIMTDKVTFDYVCNPDKSGTVSVSMWLLTIGVAVVFHGVGLFFW